MLPLPFLRLMMCALLLAAGAQFAAAHPISMSAAVVNVRENEALVELRIMAEDLVIYHGLKADANLRYAATDLNRTAQLHQEFLLKFFTIRDPQGNALPGRVERMDTTQIAEGALQTELMARTVVYLLHYPLPEKPAFLTFLQNFGGAKALMPSMMDLLTLQKGIWLDTPVQLLANQPHTVKLEWTGAPIQPPQNWRELKARREEDFRQRLGITSYAGLYSYIYLTDHEVRHEILIPLLTFEQWLPLTRRHADFLDVDEQEAMRPKIEAHFRDRHPVAIDGITVKPTVARLSFFGLDINDFAANAPPRRVGVYQARLGIILSYPASRPPQSVEMKWETFSKHVSFLRSAVYVHDQAPKEHFFVEDKPLFQWTAPAGMRRALMPQPVKHRLETVPPAARDAALIFTALHRNIYRAFDQRGDREIYEALASSVDGPLLRQLYLQFQRSLLMEEQGGAASRVQAVRIEEGAMKPARAGAGFDYHCRWRVIGTVEHWGHIHTRENEYEGTFTIAPAADGWRVTDYELHNQKRVQYQTGLRTLPQ
ncbi:MAG: hypothetical protein EXS22_05955 [Pedosphaera sp.]|nr:hypothetical protein [Pedosphaera sp.]MSU43563.1 hypothetical protein [Pedosphaera sp.]